MYFLYSFLKIIYLYCLCYYSYSTFSPLPNLHPAPLFPSLSRSPFCCLCPWGVHKSSLVNPFFMSSPKSNRYLICNDSCSHKYLSLSINFQTILFSNVSALFGVLILTVISDPLKSASYALSAMCAF